MILNLAHLQEGDLQKYSTELKPQRFWLFGWHLHVPDGSHRQVEVTVEGHV